MEDFRKVFQWYKQKLPNTVEEESICLYGKANIKIFPLHIFCQLYLHSWLEAHPKVTFSTAVWFPDTITQEIQQVCLSRNNSLPENDCWETGHYQ